MLCFLLCKKQRCVHFVGAKIHFCKTKCYKCIWCQNAFDALQKCIFASNAFLQRNAYILLCKMFSITFYFVKCSASHFPKENVQHQISFCNAQPPIDQRSSNILHLSKTNGASRAIVPKAPMFLRRFHLVKQNKSKKKTKTWKIKDYW